MKKSHFILLAIGIINFLFNIFFMINDSSNNSFKVMEVDYGMVGRINFILGIILSFIAIMIKPDTKLKHKKMYWYLLALLFFNAVIINIISTVYFA